MDTADTAGPTGSSDEVDGSPEADGTSDGVEEPEEGEGGSQQSDEAEPDDVREKFRQALQSKRGSQASGRSGPGSGKKGSGVHGGDGPALGRRTFRRKSG